MQGTSPLNTAENDCTKNNDLRTCTFHPLTYAIRIRYAPPIPLLLRLCLRSVLGDVRFTVHCRRCQVSVHFPIVSAAVWTSIPACHLASGFMADRGIAPWQAMEMMRRLWKPRRLPAPPKTTRTPHLAGFRNRKVTRKRL